MVIPTTTPYNPPPHNPPPPTSGSGLRGSSCVSLLLIFAHLPSGGFFFFFCSLLVCPFPFRGCSCPECLTALRWPVISNWQSWSRPQLGCFVAKSPPRHPPSGSLNKAPTWLWQVTNCSVCISVQELHLHSDALVTCISYPSESFPPCQRKSLSIWRVQYCVCV